MKTDHGADPLGSNQWRLAPSGEIVDRAGYDAWKASRPKVIRQNDCLGMSWSEIERMQGGKLRRTN
jgi:hypothetical protein